MSRPTIYFIRHGETDWNKARRFQGRTDIPLNSRGREQAARNGAVLADLVEAPERLAYVASPLSRASETMRIVRRTLQLENPLFDADERLVELSFGEWEGLTPEEMEARDGDIYRRFRADGWNNCVPGGESYGQLGARVADWLSQVTQDTVVASHGGVSRALRLIACQADKAKLFELPVPQDRIMILCGGKIDFV